MANKIEGQGKGFAVFLPIGTEIKGDTRRIDFLGLSSDIESAKTEMARINEEIGGFEWNMEEIDSSGKPAGNRSYYFSSATWNAPWQPKGPPPNWQEKADPTESIN